MPLIAVAGSNGKTTVKEMIAACLRAHFGDEAVLATRGKPQQPHRPAADAADAARRASRRVVEVGMNHPGETAELAKIAAPTVASSTMRSASIRNSCIRLPMSPTNMPG